MSIDVHDPGPVPTRDPDIRDTLPARDPGQVLTELARWLDEQLAAKQRWVRIGDIHQRIRSAAVDR